VEVLGVDGVVCGVPIQNKCFRCGNLIQLEIKTNVSGVGNDKEIYL